MTTIGCGCEGRGQAWVRSRPGVFMEMEDRLHDRPPLPRGRTRRRLLQGLQQRLPFLHARIRGAVRREGPVHVDLVGHLDYHDQTAAEQVDVETGETGAAEA